MSNPKEIIQGLMKFQYIHEGYELYHCSSCGARKSVDIQQALGVIDKCSPNCPWEKARIFIKDKS